MLEPKEVDFMFMKWHLTMDNSKIKSIGYEVKNRCDISMPETIRDYDQQGYHKLLM